MDAELDLFNRRHMPFKLAKAKDKGLPKRVRKQPSVKLSSLLRKKY